MKTAPLEPWPPEASASPVRIVPVRTKRAMDEFVEFLYHLRGGLYHFTPPLRRDQRLLLDRDRHPFHEHADVEYFIARMNGRTVGRIAAIENHAHNHYHNERIGFFGFLESIDDARVFAALLRAAERWAKRRGLTALRGPCSFSTNEECGLLVDGYNGAPYIMMGYHLPYYKKNVEAAGYERVEDLLCYWVSRSSTPPRYFRLAEAAERRLERQGHKLRFRQLDVKRWDDEVALVKELYNKGWERNWGFVPLTEREMDFMAKQLRPIVDPRLVLFAEINGETAGFTFALPDYNTVLKFMDGRTGPYQLALYFALRRKIRRFRLIMMGMLEKHRNKGIELVMYREFGRTAYAAGFQEAELSWILDDRNPAMKHQVEAMMGGNPYRRYRLYEKALRKGAQVEATPRLLTDRSVETRAG